MDEETYTVDVPASLIIGVMVRGMAFLTNHRLAFYAVLPNLTDEEDAPRDHRLTGTGTIHFSSSLKPKKRAFLVLKSDSINAFSSPRRLDQPWGCERVLWDTVAPGRADAALACIASILLVPRYSLFHTQDCKASRR